MNNKARSSLSDPALATKALDRVRVRPQEIQTSSNLKSLSPTVVAHDLIAINYSAGNREKCFMN
ncbi:Protein of unknown function [Cotesia congregata]|uniref:Uncharacterized protein n=1 Tax=Cotesia congregata TaxID=51543 RepID=A0A8J2MSI1_COTCN|nr:Protein of unknown function [Cotesia congregata]